MSDTGSLKLFGFRFPIRSRRTFVLLLGGIVLATGYLSYLVCHALGEFSGIPGGIVALVLLILATEVTVDGGHRLALLSKSWMRDAVLYVSTSMAAFLYLSQGEHYEGILLAGVLTLSGARRLVAWLREPHNEYVRWRRAEDARLRKKVQGVEDVQFKELDH